MAVPPVEGGGDSLLTPVSPDIPVGTPLFDLFRVYSSVSPYGLIKEFRPNAIENFKEDIEGNTTIDVIVSEEIATELLNGSWQGPFSFIISLASNVMIHRVWDRHITEVGSRFSSYIYDSYYVKNIKQEQNSRNYRLTCVGLKAYLAKRLAIPAGRNTVDGVVTIPDGSQEAKPIAASQMLKYTNRQAKGIITSLITETKTLQDIPVGWTANDLTGTATRTYLLKDFLSIEEAIDNLLDDDIGPSQIVFDGGAGGRDAPSFMFQTDGYEKGYPYTTLSARSAEMFKPVIEEVENDVVNNIWTVGNASDGNMLVGHRVQSGSTSKILLQEVDTQRNDIRTSSLLNSYTLGILQKSGQSIRTMSLPTGMTQRMLLAFVGNYITIKAPEEPSIDGTSWTIVSRTLNMEAKQIEFDLVEIQLVEEE